MKKTILKSVSAASIAFSTIIVPFNVLSTTMVQAAAQEVKPIYKTRAEIPSQYKWKLEHIYPSKRAWEADVKKVTELADQFTQYQGKLKDSSTILKKALDDYTAMMRIHDKAYVYALMSKDVNSSNPELQALSDQAENMTVYVMDKISWLSPEIVNIPDAKMNSYLKEKPLAPYKQFLSDTLRTKPHTLTQELEQLLAQSATLATTPENTFSMLTKDIKFPNIKDETGKEVELTRSNFISYMENKNREVRKQAYEAYYQTYTKYQDTFAQILTGEVKANNFYSQAQKYSSAMEASLTPNNVPTKVYDQLIETVNKNLPLMHRYMDLKKKMLKVNELHMYDIYTPIVQSENKYIPFDEAKNMVLIGLQPLGEEYTKILKEAFESGWIDVYPTEDKRSGAYQWGAFDTHPYLLFNYEGTKGDVSTIAHELGHALQSYYTNKKQPYISSAYPIFTAEVASTMNENILWEYQYKNAKSKEEKMLLLNQRLENFRTTLFRQTQFAEFEKAIHEKELNGESLNAETLKKLYAEINQKYYGKTMTPDEEISMEWARVPHFYYNFYVYQYATSFAASTALAKQILTEGKPAFERVRDNFLAAGNSSDPISILKAAGVDMSSPQPIEETMVVFKQTLDELEKLLNEK